MLIFPVIILSKAQTHTVPSFPWKSDWCAIP